MEKNRVDQRVIKFTIFVFIICYWAKLIGIYIHLLNFTVLSSAMSHIFTGIKY